MARMKNIGTDGDNNARIKVFYFEAENVSSDLASAITALANAIRPPAAPVVIHSPTPPQIETPKIPKNNNGQTVLFEEGESNTVEGTVPPSNTPSAPRPNRERKPFQGKILDNIAWDGGGTPFVDYVKQKNPQNTMKRFLVIAAWFKKYGGQDNVSANLIFNAYRKMTWGTALADFSQPLRDGSKPKNGYFIGDKKGNYSITNIGLDAADRVGGNKEGGES